MKLIAILVSSIAALSMSCQPAYAKDDGGHAFLPPFDPTAVHVALPVSLQDPAPEPQTWSGAWLYRLTGDKDDRASAGALKHITFLTRPGSRHKLTLDGYAGFTLMKAVPAAAILLGYQAHLFDQLDVGLHFGPLISQGQPSGWSIGVSAVLRF